VGQAAIRGLLRYQFESVDCTGTPYLSFPFPPELRAGLFALAAIGPAGEVQVPDGILLNRNIQSEQGTIFSLGCDSTSPGFRDVRVPLTVGTVNGFTPPFRLRRE
jgi:hypothetical protein